VYRIQRVKRPPHQVDGVPDRLLHRNLVAECEDADDDDADVAHLPRGFERQAPARLDHAQRGEDHEEADG
jgi:hypothetical protein